MNKDELKEKLSQEAYHVTQEKGTEAPFTGKYHDNHTDGMYKCVVCGEELFSSDTKFDSGTGWPSFTAPTNEAVVAEHDDNSLLKHRTEVVCKKCGAHLGHVFPDGPTKKPDGSPDTGKRYCINSCALDFNKKEE